MPINKKGSTIVIYEDLFFFLFGRKKGSRPQLLTIYKDFIIKDDYITQRWSNVWDGTLLFSFPCRALIHSVFSRVCTVPRTLLKTQEFRSKWLRFLCGASSITRCCMFETVVVTILQIASQIHNTMPHSFA
jgi:hypothetical protein